MYIYFELLSYIRYFQENGFTSTFYINFNMEYGYCTIQFTTDLAIQFEIRISPIIYYEKLKIKYLIDS